MMRIFLFSGTTEGRMLSDLLANEKIPHTVCVATDYGKDMMEENPYAEILVGRMDEMQMRKLFLNGKNGVSDREKAKEANSAVKGGNGKNDGRSECLVIDATHPYATEVTEHLKRAANAT
ncbi:MAG: precorrin-6A/cobalt-precorrin-6A reductase, partial [Lachnospiraceae bacterium]|nr:precorrin-6A/cobalt-precorrin-6A reductase [Lachnospiraceae bacterium]